MYEVVGGTLLHAFYGYAGIGKGLNNPADNFVSGVGPLPVGTYTIGKEQNFTFKEGKKTIHLEGAMRLTPNPSNRMGKRFGFLIHGSKGDHMKDSSNGCIVLEPSKHRNVIGTSGDRTLHVFSGETNPQTPSGTNSSFRDIEQTLNAESELCTERGICK